MTNKSKESTIREQESAIAAAEEDSQIDLVTYAKGHSYSYIDTSPAELSDRGSSLRSQKPIPTPSPSSDSNSAMLIDSRIEMSDSPEDFIEFLRSQIVKDSDRRMTSQLQIHGIL